MSDTTFETQAYINWGYLDHYVNNASDFDDVYTMANAMKDELEEDMYNLIDISGIFSDLLNGAISEIDFNGLAQGVFDEIEPDEGDTLDVEIGPTSEGSMLLDDIIKGIEDYVPENMVVEYYASKTDELDGYIVDEMCDYLNEHLPDNIEFGSHPDDGACYGFWEVKNDD